MRAYEISVISFVMITCKLTLTLRYTWVTDRAVWAEATSPVQSRADLPMQPERE